MKSQLVVVAVASALLVKIVDVVEDAVDFEAGLVRCLPWLQLTMSSPCMRRSLGSARRSRKYDAADVEACAVELIADLGRRRRGRRQRIVWG